MTTFFWFAFRIHLFHTFGWTLADLGPKRVPNEVSEFRAIGSVFRPISRKWPKWAPRGGKASQRTPKWSPRVPKWSPRDSQMERFRLQNCGEKLVGVLSFWKVNQPQTHLPQPSTGTAGPLGRAAQAAAPRKGCRPLGLKTVVKNWWESCPFRRSAERLLTCHRRPKTQPDQSAEPHTLQHHGKGAGREVSKLC